MLKSNFQKGMFTVLVGIVLWFLPVPAGLKPAAWHMFAVIIKGQRRVDLRYPKEEEATQKVKNTTQKPLTATQNAILDYLKAHSTATRQEVAKAIGNITEDGVKYNIGKLQQYGRLKREKGRKNSSWLVIDME